MYLLMYSSTKSLFLGNGCGNMLIVTVVRFSPTKKVKLLFQKKKIYWNSEKKKNVCNYVSFSLGFFNKYRVN